MQIYTQKYLTLISTGGPIRPPLLGFFLITFFLLTLLTWNFMTFHINLFYTFWQSYVTLPIVKVKILVIIWNHLYNFLEKLK